MKHKWIEMNVEHPVDAWRCTRCMSPIGWAFDDRYEEQPTLSWRECARDNADLMICELCATDYTELNPVDNVPRSITRMFDGRFIVMVDGQQVYDGYDELTANRYMSVTI